MSLEITAIHGSAKDFDSPQARHITNRANKGYELLKYGETDLLWAGGWGSYEMKEYILRKFDVSERKILVDEKLSTSVLQECVNFRNGFVQPNGYENIGAISTDWQMSRIRKIYERVFPQRNIEHFWTEDGREEKYVKSDVGREKLVTLVDSIRLNLPIDVAVSPFTEKLLLLAQELYLLARRV